MNLYEINEGIRAIMNRAADNGGELTEADMTELNALALSRADKLKAYAYVVAECKAASEAIKAESDMLAAKAQAQANIVERLKRVVYEDMVAHGEKKAGDKIRGWRIQNGPPKVDVTDETAIPAALWTTPAPELRKAEISDLLKAGKEVPGAQLIQTEHIRLT